MKQWAKCVIMLSIIAGIVLFPGMWDNFSAWADDGICDPGDPENLLTIFHGGENGKQVPDEDEIDPGAFTMPSLPMRLVICKPEVSDTSPEDMVTLDVVAGKEKIILLDQAQENEIPTSQPFPLAELPALVWVKPTQSSEQEHDIRICAKFQKECQDFVTATALLNLEAHWPGTMNDPGEIVSEAEEDNSLNLIGSVNDDDDNDDDIIDNDREQSPSIVTEDDEIMTFVVRKLGPEQSSSDEPVFQEGTLELFAGDGLHVFTADGTQELTLPLSVDLANPSGPLANVLYENVTLLVEANIPVERTMVELIYSQNGKEMARDEVHLKVVQPIIKGGFHRGSVRYSEAMQLGSNWVVCREFDETHPLSVFLLADPVYQRMQYKRQGAAAYTHEGWRVGLSYFEQLAARWNVFLDAVPFVPKYEAETLLKQFCAATGVPEDVAKTEGFVTDPDDPITESGFYDIRLCSPDQNKDMFKDLQVKVIKPGQIDGWFRIIGDVNDPYLLEEALTEVPEEDETFFRTLGGMRVHLEAALTDELNDYAAHLVSYTWYVMPRTTNIIIPENSFPLLDQDLENRGIPKAVRDKLNELLVGNTFESPTALLNASKPAFEGYTITDEVVNALQKYVDEGFFPGYFVKNADDGLNALRPKHNNRLQDITYWNTENHTALENLNSALRETTYRGNNGKYAIRGHRVTKQSLAALKEVLPASVYEKLKDRNENTTGEWCLRGTDLNGWSFRNVQNGEFYQFIAAVKKVLTDEEYETYHTTMIGYTDQVTLFGSIISSAASHQQYYEACREALLRHVAPTGQFFPNYRTTRDLFMLTDYALEQLKKTGVPEEEIVDKLTGLTEQEFATEEAFLNAVAAQQIEEELLKEYQTRILKYAKEAPPLARDDLWGSYRRFAITAEALEALNAAGMSAELIDQLRPLQDTTYATEEELLAAVEASLGPAPTQQHHDILLTHTAWTPTIYWQGAYRNDLDETITISLTVKDAHKKFRFIPFTRRITSRVLELKNPLMTGDDVSMLHIVLRQIGESYPPKLVQACGTSFGYCGTPVAITGIFDDDTTVAVNRIRSYDQIGANQTGTVDLDMLRKIELHWNDYLAAFEAFPNDPRVDRNHAQYPVWCLNAVTMWAQTYTDAIHQSIAPNITRGDLLDAWVHQENANLGHWGFNVNHRITLGGADNVGSIGFSQIVSKYKYGATPATILHDLNVYKPNDAIKTFAAWSSADGFRMAFTGNPPRFQKTKNNLPNQYPRIVTIHDSNGNPVPVGNTYTDDAKDRLSKGIMVYNHGTTVYDQTWPELLKDYDCPSAPPYNVRWGIKYTLEVQQRAGIPLRTWTWETQRIVSKEKWKSTITVAQAQNDILVIQPGTEVEPGQVLVSPGRDGVLNTVLTLDQLEQAEVNTFSFDYSEEDWLCGNNDPTVRWIDKLVP